MKISFGNFTFICFKPLQSWARQITANTHMPGQRLTQRNRDLRETEKLHRPNRRQKHTSYLRPLPPNALPSSTSLESPPGDAAQGPQRAWAQSHTDASLSPSCAIP